MAHSELSIHDVASIVAVDATHVQGPSNTRWLKLRIQDKDGSETGIALFANSHEELEGLLAGLSASLQECRIRSVPQVVPK